MFDLPFGVRLVPPRAARYHPELVRFARDGRFVGSIDTRTGKTLPSGLPTNYLPGVGFIGRSGEVVRFGDSPWPDIPPDLLELWAQVAVRGELGPGGEFVKWKEDEWERKRQELAARPAPYPDFPFPGHVATDRLHWLRREWAEAADADKPKRAADLLRRAEQVGDAAEAARWRRYLDALGPHTAPPPREVRR